jgi:hypothetical protein
MKTLRTLNLLAKNPFSDKLFNRMLPVLKQTPAHKLALAAAGLTVTATAVAGPALAIGAHGHPADAQRLSSSQGSGADHGTMKAADAAPADKAQPVDNGTPTDKASDKASSKASDKGKPADPTKKAPKAKQSDADAAAKALAAQKAAEASMPRDKTVAVDYQAQTTFFYCGPAATRIVASAGGHELSQDDTAAKLGTTVNGTPSAVDTTRVLNDIFGGNTYHTTSMPDKQPTQQQTEQVQADVMHTLNQGRAIVANIAGATTDVTGAQHEFDGGHYVAVVGYHDQGGTVEISDPADVNGASDYWISTTNLAQWMATRGYSS